MMQMKSDSATSSWRGTAHVLSALVCGLVTAGSAGAKATFTTFDVGFVESIDSSNTVTGYNSTQAFVRTADGTVTMFDVPGGSYPEAWGINDSGEIAGFYYDSSGQIHGFERAADGSITTFDGPASDATEAYHINNKGEIVGRYHNDTGEHGFVRAAGGRIRTFDVQGAISINPGCINDKGVIAGAYLDSGDLYHGFFRASDGAITAFDVPGATGTYGYCINIKGSITGVYGDGRGGHGFVRASDGTITTFDGTDCDIYPAGINRKGVIAGSCESRDNPKHFFGFVRKPDGTIKMFHVPGGGPHTMPAGINDAGVIAGSDMHGGFLRFP